MKRGGVVGMSLVLVAALCAGQHRTAAQQRDSAPAESGVRGTVRFIRLPELPSELPPGKGRETVVAACATCHTTRYVMIQPPLSRETWGAVVTKMQKTFSAPVRDEQVPEIVDYLVAVRGPVKDATR